MQTIQSSKTRSTAIMVLTAGFVPMFGLGCNEPSKRLNAPPQGHTEYPSNLQCVYVPMTDNALLSDMSMSSIHFVPHQTELNSNGVRRLQRLAEIMKIYGGTLNYDGVSEDKDLSKARVHRLEDFLVDSGLERDKFKVEVGLAGGPGMNAPESAVAQKNLTAKEEGGGGEPNLKQLLNLNANPGKAQ
jgi:hypothetical protein